MISLTASKKFRHTEQEIFEAIDNVRKLGRIKRELGEFTVARSETGLQIIDTRFSFIVMKFDSRLTYVTRPNQFAELKQIKGKLKKYTCTYTLRDEDLECEVIVNLSIKLPYGPLGFITALLAKPLYAFRLGRELRALERILTK